MYCISHVLGYEASIVSDVLIGVHNVHVQYMYYACTHECMDITARKCSRVMYEYTIHLLLTYLSKLRMKSGSCAREEGRVKGGQLADATCDRYIFVQSTTVFNRACTRPRGRDRVPGTSVDAHIICIILASSSV